ncbi:sigma-70 family RNA polymerase sigma factor [Pseudomonas sp. CCC3.1]|uniref:sigma-70 family RNA polymerase sigma factor n=1 Tax=Pseudomonas sp. CCC3.1 TaxID=3048607 RepID=UPI002AC8D5F6|nr:sigma-70 family RNA polymerase sigma factor [Pseudomonas sp. CCC3.1]MEB0204604.1 sigma-70 family RNA polymerase sigma factor [Pseudomonas sp. CCC3.1]WPX38698.1 sigma-70 family RNA polymerase sigma factor [Pseudomonas sp. CCC3.1]
MTDTTARLQLYLDHRPALINYAKVVVGDHARAEDVVQDAFLRFFASTDEVVEQPVAYLYRIVRNLALDAVRRQATEKRQQQSPPQWMRPGQELSPEQRVVHGDDASRIAATLASLPEQMRIAVEMHRLGGFTLQQTADHLNISLSSAHRLVKDAIVHLASSVATHDLAPSAHCKERPYA